MPQVTQERRTVMYSYGANGEVIVHKLPFNANEKIGMSKLQKFVKRGFMFDDPRVKGRGGQPEVLVTDEVDLSKPEMVTAEPELCKYCLADGREVLKTNCNFHNKEG